MLQIFLDFLSDPLTCLSGILLSGYVIVNVNSVGPILSPQFSFQACQVNTKAQDKRQGRKKCVRVDAHKLVCLVVGTLREKGVKPPEPLRTKNTFLSFKEKINRKRRTKLNH